ncbi:MAG: hypothetical protein JWP97_6099 [Labilithrix sp.]|nr:hypothetical protein [Labilithrix sp.]
MTLRSLVSGAAVGAMALVTATACVHAPRVVNAGRMPYVFWPPSPPFLVREDAADATPADRTFGDAANRVLASLRADGRSEVRLYPIGASYEHGFAVTTRLARVGPAGLAFSSLHPAPVELRFLENARTTPLAEPGVHEALLVAYTDLPVGPGSHRAPAWDVTTVMETGLPPPPLPAARVVGPGFRRLVFTYRYERQAEDPRDGRRVD